MWHLFKKVKIYTVLGYQLVLKSFKYLLINGFFYHIYQIKKLNVINYHKYLKALEYSILKKNKKTH